MKKMIGGFVFHPGYHCISTTLQNYFNYWGFNFTEAMAFGLDSSLGFCYRKHDVLTSIPAFYTGGRNYTWVDNICEVLELSHKKLFETNGEKAWEDTKASINNNIPVIVELDKSKLDYWKGILREVPFHMVLLVGYDDKHIWLGEVYDKKINDKRQSNNLHVTSIECVKKARGADLYWGDIHNAQHIIDVPQNYKLRLKEAIYKAIKKNTLSYLKDTNEGSYRELQLFTNELESWPEILPLKKFDSNRQAYVSPLRAQLIITGKMFDEVGTGGGNFRSLYSKYLYEVSKIFSNDHLLLKAAKMMHQSSLNWIEISKYFHYSSRLDHSGIFIQLLKVKKLLEETVELEAKAFYLLEQWEGT
ncbi:BtrH N-terminal domain-containing protein [Paenibacillus sp. FSL L8-0436]|uniref:BtrH N-terminal domain-containing protein n=1 Tax=Paenibacillus sp. FSL L8-0436 TaxID=2954686 RepID=UPI003159385F